MKRAASPLDDTDPHEINNNLLPPNKKVSSTAPPSSTTEDLLGEKEVEVITKVSAVLGTTTNTTTSSTTRPEVAILRSGVVEKEITAGTSVLSLERSTTSSSTMVVRGQGGGDVEVHRASEIVLENPSHVPTVVARLGGEQEEVTTSTSVIEEQRSSTTTNSSTELPRKKKTVDYVTKSYREFMDIAKSDYFSIDVECGMWVDCSACGIRIKTRVRNTAKVDDDG